MTEIVKNLGGRPIIETDWELLNKVLARGGRMEDCVYLVGLSASTIERRIREEHDMTFSNYRDLQLTGIRMKILDAQIDKAINEKDTVMLKHLGEHLCGQVPKSQNQNLNVNTSVEDYIRGLRSGDINAG
jgi:hypothetical protein